MGDQHDNNENIIYSNILYSKQAKNTTMIFLFKY